LIKPSTTQRSREMSEQTHQIEFWDEDDEVAPIANYTWAFIPREANPPYDDVRFCPHCQSLKLTEIRGGTATCRTCNLVRSEG
jgi:hypothetical protein